MDKPKDTAGIIASVAAAYAMRPDATVDDIVALVTRLGAELGDAAGAAAALTGLSGAAPGTMGALPVGQAPAMPAPAAAIEAAVPALPIERAVTRDKVYCLCCGKAFKMLKRHLGAEHGLTEEEYRLRFNLPDEMPLVAPSYSERKANYAKRVGFGKYTRVNA